MTTITGSLSFIFLASLGLHHSDMLGVPISRWRRLLSSQDRQLSFQETTSTDLIHASLQALKQPSRGSVGGFEELIGSLTRCNSRAGPQCTQGIRDSSRRSWSSGRRAGFVRRGLGLSYTIDEGSTGHAGCKKDLSDARAGSV